MGLSRRLVIACAVIFALAGAMLLPGIQYPHKPYFDETHYVPAARQILHTGTDPNYEHAPLGKEFIAAGIAIFGDRPFGWRFMGALFGALALVGMYLWTLALFGEENPAGWATAVTALNQVLYVQARIAMLDVFAVAFSIWALAAFTATWRFDLKTRTRALLAATGVFLGLASASKWIGVFVWLLVVAIVITIKMLQGWKTRFDEPSKSDWYRSDLWQEISGWHWLVFLFAIPLGTYYLAYAPLGFHALLPGTFIGAQSAIFGANATLATTHPYMSRWFDWPFIIRPVWYYFAGSHWDTSKAMAAAVLYLGNPAVFWAGIVAVMACCYGWIVRRRSDAFLILTAFGASYLVWAVVARSLQFAFYYLPATMALGPALAYAFYRTPLCNRPWTRWVYLAACLVTFGYFLPISNAAIGVSEPAFNHLMWFHSWR